MDVELKGIKLNRLYAIALSPERPCAGQRQRGVPEAVRVPSLPPFPRLLPWALTP